MPNTFLPNPDTDSSPNLCPAKIRWSVDASGKPMPLSDTFDDVYFSRMGGLAESQYVFLQGNNLATRFAQTIGGGGHFIIAETGFGTGLNFLACALLWAESMQSQSPQAENTQRQYLTGVKFTAPTAATLQFISSEKFPLTAADLTHALSAWRGQNAIFDALIDDLLHNYPPPFAGCHRRILGQSLGLTMILDLWLGDAGASFSALADATHQTNGQAVDAWFLDGFSPKKNGQLWSDFLFEQIKRLSGKQTTLATFSAAGYVKKQLAAIGATVQKRLGFGHKRDMLTACFSDPLEQNLSTMSPQVLPIDLPTNPPPKSAIVIGAGIAGLCAAYCLAQRGFSVQLLDKGGVLAGASGNPCALLAPKLGQAAGAVSNLSLQSFFYSQNFYCQLNGLMPAGHAPIFCQTGVADCLLPSKKTHAQRQQLIAQYPPSLVRPYKNPAHGHQFCAFFPTAGLVFARRLADFVLSHPNIRLIQDEILSLTQKLTANALPMIHAKSATQSYISNYAVICAGHESQWLTIPTLSKPLFKTRHIRGQVSWTTDAKTVASFRSNYHQANKYQGYACAFHDNDDQDCLLFGASFVRNSDDTTTRSEENEQNCANLLAALPHIHGLDQATLHARAAIRSQTPDYCPMVGQLSAGIFISSAMGSKGFSLAPWCAEIVASLICQEALPLSIDLLNQLAPQRPRLLRPLNN